MQANFELPYSVSTLMRRPTMPPQHPSNVILKFVGGPMDGTYRGGEDYPSNVGLLLNGYYVMSKQGEVGATVQATSARGLQDTFKPEHLRTHGMKGGKYVVVSREEIDDQTVIKIKYEGIGGHPDAQ
jgi:hypothetical protein